MRKKESTGLLMITQLFLPTKGGTAVSFDDDFRRLGGKEVHIVTEEVPGGKAFDRTHPNSIHRLTLKRRPWMKPESLFIYGKLLFNALRLTLTHRIGAVFAGRALPEGLVALITGRLTGRAVLIYAHGEELTGWGRGKKFQAMCFALRHADWVLSNSDNTGETLIDLIGVEPARVAVIYPTVDAERFRPRVSTEGMRAVLNLSGQQSLILSVGRLMPRKGFDNLIRAIPKLLRQGLDVHYALIGIGNDLETLQGLAREFGIEERVHFLGHVNYEDLPRWYNACDLFAMPNRDIGGDSEGFGLVFLEAAASARPAIAGRAGGTGSAVVDGVTGLRVDGEDVNEVAKGVADLLSNPERAEKMGNAARQRVLENFTHQRRVGQLRKLASSNQL